MPLLPPVIATLLADTKEYMAKMNEADEKMAKFGLTAEKSGNKLQKFTSSAATAITGLGVAFVAGAVDSGVKFSKMLDDLQNQAGYTAKQADEVGKSILNISNDTAQSADKIGSAYLEAAKAGIGVAKATQIVSDAAKVAAITGGDVASTTQTLIGIQNLQIAKGMSVAQVSDLMVEANKRHLGSLNALVGAMTGRVGGALAAAHVSLAELAAVSDVASAAGYSQSRAFTQLATGLNKIESPTAATTKSMGLLGINANKLATIARHPGTGLVDVLRYLEERSKATGVAMNTLISGTFGPGAIGLVDDLTRHLGKLSSTVSTLSKSSDKGLNTAFGVTKGQLDFQLEQLKTQAENALTGVGLLLLPSVKDIATFTENAVKYFKAHPLLDKIATDASIGLFATSLALKVGQQIAKLPGIGNLIKKIPGLGSILGGQPTAAQAETQIGWLERISGQLGVEEGELATADTELLKGGGVSVLSKFLGEGALARFGGALGLSYLIDKMVTQPVMHGFKGISISGGGMNFGGMTGGGDNSGTGDNKLSQRVFYNYNGVMGSEYITKGQLASLDKYFGGAAKVSALSNNSSQAFYNALENFKYGDVQKNYTVKISIKA